MTVLFLVVLVGAWTVVLLPAVLRARGETPITSAERFQKGMKVISPGYGGRWIIAPASDEERETARSRRAKFRRRRVLALLLGSLPVTALLGVLSGGLFWELHVACWVGLGIYVVLLLEAKRRRIETREKVTQIERPVPPPFFAETVRVVGDDYGTANEDLDLLMEDASR